jgi:type I restriction enzyme S subunit
LISITADLGIIGVIPKRFEEAYVNQHIALVRLRKSEISPRFIGYFLASRNGQVQVEQLNESGAKAGLNLPTIKNLLVTKTNLAEQERIAESLDLTTKVSGKYKHHLTKLRSIKTGLMQDLLTGKVRVTSFLTEQV